MTHEPGHVPKMVLEPQKRVRYLKIIALFKIGKGLLLLLLGISILFFSAKDVWIDRISDWADTEILLGHSKPITYLLHRLEDVMQGGHLRATAFLALFYCGVLMTEGIGVYMQKRWAELLMIFATAALIPLEIRHLYHHPTPAAVLILTANCFIVWFLYAVLKREKPANNAGKPPELVGIR